MAAETGYMIIDIGTGNVRVAITNQQGEVMHLERDNVRYVKDDLYPDSVYFKPDELWEQVIAMAVHATRKCSQIKIRAITASSQREGIVLLDANGKSLIGLSNHDHRGREWEYLVQDKDYVYALTGRYPTSLFSALKVVGIRERRPELYNRLDKIVSISDWAQYCLTGILSYEHSQASETLLYNVAKKTWSAELCAIFDIQEKVLPPLVSSGTVLGTVLPEWTEKLQLAADTIVVVGGADTQLAIKSTRPAADDIVIVSGTTTPIAKIVKEFFTDPMQRTWTNRHIDTDHFILEANAGVTGLNYQRLKEIFYPNEGYDVIERELAKSAECACVASLGSLVASEKSPITRGGFLFNTPVSHELTRAAFVRATLWDIACSIKENLEILSSISGSSRDFVWGCGGGFQSSLLRQFIADLTGKTVLVRQGFEQSSVLGGALVCNDALGIHVSGDSSVVEVLPQPGRYESRLYDEWKEARNRFKQSVQEAIL